MENVADGREETTPSGRRLFLQGLAVAWIVGPLRSRVAEATVQTPGIPEAGPSEEDLPWQARIAPQGEPGEPLVVGGQVLNPRGEEPAPGVVVYGYHTDKQGYYARNGGNQPPRLRGWAKTDACGRFEFRTIRPAPYPGRDVPAHVHFVLWGAGYPRQWVESLRFEGDPLLTRVMLEESRRQGRFASVRPLRRGGDGVLRCSIDVRLGTISNF